MKVLLINPIVREWAKPNCLPLGLGYIGAILSAAGHEIEVLDINALRYDDQEVDKYIRESNYDIAGIGGLITVYNEVKSLIGLCKKHHPGRPVMAGGSVVTSIPMTFMKKTGADIGVIGEGELTCLELLDILEHGGNLKNVKGIMFRNKNGDIVSCAPRTMIQKLDDLPFPRYDLFPMDVYLKNPIGWLNVKKWENGKSDNNQMTSINLSSSRGCVFKCIYCYHDFMGANYRKRSPENIVDEIEFLLKNYGPLYYHFIDDNFVTYRKNVFEFCQLIRKRKLDIYWGCSGRVNSMDEKLLLAMKEAGCKFITYGVESGSQRMLNVMNKKVKVEDVKHVLRLTMKHIGYPSCTFIVGTPGENRETIQETIDFCKDLSLSPEAIFFITPYPGTPLYNMALKNGKLSLEQEEEFVMSLGEQGEKLLVNFSEMSDEELIHAKWKMAEELGAQNLRTHKA